LPRLAGPEVLARTIENGIALTTWSQETFAFAESFDESAGRYRGLQTGKLVRISHDSVGLLVKPDVAKRQLKSESEPGPRPPDNPPGPAGPEPGPDGPPGPVPPPIDLEPGPKRFHGTVELDSLRVGRDAGRIAEEVISHLAGIVGARVRVTLEIEADIPSGASDHLVRTVSENSRTLKFIGFGFEKE
ncbi:MAG: AAA+ family ATPase, partial [Calditrichaeota bacterium]|nr:AAA+ family ATPase [Calditrichota bacterium]